MQHMNLKKAYTVLYGLPFLRGTIPPTPKSSKISMFWALSQNYQHLFWKIIYASYTKLSKEPKNSIKIKVGQGILSYWSKTNILTVLIYNLKTAWPIKISMPFLSSLNNFL